MCVAPFSWRTRISLILESTRASKIGIAAPPDRPKTYSTPSRSRQRMSASAPVWNFATGAAAMGVVAESSGVDLLAGDAGTGNLAFKEGRSKGTSALLYRPVASGRYMKFSCRFDHFDATLFMFLKTLPSICRHKPRLARAV